MNDEDFCKCLEEYFPINLLTEEQREQAIKLNEKFGWIQAVKYIKTCCPKLEMKSSKIYCDLYIRKL